MEIKTKERKLIYYPIEKDEVVERNLDEFIVFMSTGRFETSTGKRWHYQNEICSFFGIENTLYFDEDKDADFPNVNSHTVEKANLLQELIDAELIVPKSSTSFYADDSIVDEDIANTQLALETIRNILQGKAKTFSPFIHELKETCVWSQNVNKKPFIAWHENKFYPTATVDRLKEIGWSAFYNENKDNIIRKREFFKKVTN